MSFHRAVPVSRDIHEPDTPGQEWRCVGCGATTTWADGLEGDPCPALYFLLDDEPDGAA